MSNARVHQVWKWLQWKFNTKTAHKVLYGKKNNKQAVVKTEGTVFPITDLPAAK